MEGLFHYGRHRWGCRNYNVVNGKSRAAFNIYIYIPFLAEGLKQYMFNPYDNNQKYLLPALAPPSETELSAAQAALTAKYDEAAAILASLQTETEEIKVTLQEQCSKIDESVDGVNSAISTMKGKESTRDEELKTMREEIDSIKGLMEKVPSFPIFESNRLHLAE